tara:strand:+ start:64266 stop:64532 length:267 start_codon:yes stop_codon:yes gene_type:complete
LKRSKKIKEFLAVYPTATVRLEFNFPETPYQHMSIPLESYDELEFFSDYIEAYDLISSREYEALVSKHVNLSIRSQPKLNFYTKNPKN